MLLSFNDCPNKCVDGKIYIPRTKTYIPCEYCAKKRLEQVVKSEETDNKTIEELHLPITLTGIMYEFESVVPSSQLPDLEPDSVERVKERASEVMSSIAAGVLPEHSLLFNFGRVAHSTNYIVPLIKRAYAIGIDVAPYLNSNDLYLVTSAALHQLELTFDIETEIGVNIKYRDLLKRDLSVVHILAGAEDKVINMLKGYMQARAERGKPTIFVTDTWTPAVKGLHCNEPSLDLCELIAIEYKQKVKQENITQAMPMRQNQFLSPRNSFMQ